MGFKIDLDVVVKDIKVHEGFRDTVYDDTLGKPTIGYGFLIDSLVLDEDDCDRILAKKLAKLVSSVKATFPWLTDQPHEVKVVVINMSYQMGVNGVSKFKKFLQALQENDYLWASSEMLDSRWSKQTPNRAFELSERIKKLA